MRSIAFITTQAFSLINFRGSLIRAIVAKNTRVYALAPDFDDQSAAAVVDLGAIPVRISMSRTGLNPFVSLIDTWKLTRVLKRLNPDIVFSYFIKPVIFGSIAAWLARVPNRFAMIEGLGYSFESDKNNGVLRWTLQITAKLLLKFAFGRLNKVFFLNNDDVDLLVSANIVSLNKTILIDGIGLDLDWYVPVEPIVKPITFVLTARMIKEKGIYDFIEAARMVKAVSPAVRFLLVGGVDLNPGSIKESELASWVDEGLVEWAGWVGDVRPWLARSSVFILPSYYREGLPRSTQEAMAMGRPVITTDWVGCRNTVTHGVNGFMVPICNPKSLAEAMLKFVEHPELVKSMGAESRRIAEERFNVHIINRKIMVAMEFAMQNEVANSEAKI